jgi:hypothetical protein
VCCENKIWLCESLGIIRYHMLFAAL